MKLMTQITNPALPPVVGAGSDGGSALAILISSLWRAVIMVGGLALLIYLVWGGLSWVMAGGDKGKVEEARNRITQGLMGMAILAASLAIVMFLREVFGFDLLRLTFYGPPE